MEDTWWRTFHVTPGLTNFVATAGCADTDLDGIEVPASTALFYIWVDFTNPAAPTVMHTTFPSPSVVTHWSGYPALPDGIRPIAKIVTTDSRATITQLQQGNIWPSGSGGGSPTWI